MKIAIATDAWHPQVNGVVRTLAMTVAELERRGHDVLVLTSEQLRTIPCPTYPEIRLALGCGPAIRKALERFRPDAVHICTEGPIGWAARAWCRREERPFTTSLHTRFPDYVALRTKMPASWFWPILKRFHGAAALTFVATDTLAEEVHGRGILHTHRWSRGVDLALFSPDAPPLPDMVNLPRPIQLYVGRVAPEKNIEAFLATEVPGTKVVVGDGPALELLRRRYPATLFLGKRHGAELASAYASADVFVFPSRTDTFGLVVIEALASGLPVAAFPVQGPLDIIGEDGLGRGGRSRIGALRDDLSDAIGLALTGDRKACVAEARAQYSWQHCTDQFLAGLASAEAEASRAGRKSVLAAA